MAALVLGVMPTLVEVGPAGGAVHFDYEEGDKTDEQRRTHAMIVLAAANGHRLSADDERKVARFRRYFGSEWKSIEWEAWLLAASSDYISTFIHVQDELREKGWADADALRRIFGQQKLVKYGHVRPSPGVADHRDQNREDVMSEIRRLVRR